MDQNTKNRLVGVIVIFALAVIFLPMILDGSGVRKADIEVVIPPQPLVSADPEFDSKIIELQASVDALPELEPRYVDRDNSVGLDQDPGTAPAGETESATKADAPEPVSTPVEAQKKTEPPPVKTAEPKKPTAVAKAGGESWVLQVGSFQDRGKALAQRDKLRKSNIAAVFIEQFKINNKSSYRVRLGPFLNRDQTRVAQNKIKAKHDIDGIIMKYER